METPDFVSIAIAGIKFIYHKDRQLQVCGAVMDDKARGRLYVSAALITLPTAEDYAKLASFFSACADEAGGRKPEAADVA